MYNKEHVTNYAKYLLQILKIENSVMEFLQVVDKFKGVIYFMNV